MTVFTFDNIATMEKKVRIFRQLKGLLRPAGRIINLVSSPEIYTLDGVSFKTECFHENFVARRGDIVRTIMTDVFDARPVEAIFWPDDAYQEVYQQAGLKIGEVHRPLGYDHGPFAWVNKPGSPLG